MKKSGEELIRELIEKQMNYLSSKIDTFEPETQNFINSLESNLLNKITSQELRMEIAKQIYGRLRRI